MAANAPLAPVKPPSRATAVIVFALLALVVIYSVAAAINPAYGNTFFVTPFIPGFICGAWSLRHPYRNGFIVLALGLVIAVATLHEGAACVFMSLPIVIPVCIIGAFIGNVVRRYVHTRRAKAAVTTLVLLAQLGGQQLENYLDDPAKHPWHAVRNEVAVGAPPDAVFATLTGPLALDGPWPAVLSAGLPIPRAMAVETPGLGGKVRFTFNHGSAVGEIVRWREGRELAFVIKTYDLKDPPFFRTRLSGDEHFGLKTERVTDWLTFGELAYEIVPRPDGGSTLVRATTFQRHLFPSFYFGWLEETVVRRGGDRLLEQLKARAESRLLKVSARDVR